MSIEVVKIKVMASDLDVGMYVCELDRSWLESPFLFQGFLLETEEEVQEVATVCEYVYVDLNVSHESVMPRLQQLARAINRPSANQPAEPHNRGGADGGQDYKEHLLLARKIYNRTHDYINKTQSDVAQGAREIDTETARSLVNDMIDNILVKPHAMLWLTHLKLRHEYTLTHSINVCILALTFGRHMQLERAQLESLGLGALLHDIGKLRVPTEILDKPGKLTREEYEIMKRHPGEGYEIVKTDLMMPAESIDIVLHHHERISGKGYPDALKDADIPRLTKMTSIVDVYDAITSDRCYHDGLSPYTALQNIYGWTAASFDKELVEAFMGCMGIYPVGSLVELNQGQLGIVIATTPRTKLRPMLLLLTDKDRQPLKTRRILNLSMQEWDKGKERLEIRTVLDPRGMNINVRQILEQESLSQN